MVPLQELETKALSFAAQCHKGQKDKVGHDYIDHPNWVANCCNLPEEKIVALLHDVMEDCGITEDMLMEQGFSDNIIEAVKTCTKKKHEDYFDYIRRVGRNPISRVVKMHDLEHNMNILRFKDLCQVTMDIKESDLRNRECYILNEKDLYRLNKYLVAYRMLERMNKDDL